MLTGARCASCFNCFYLSKVRLSLTYLPNRTGTLPASFASLSNITYLDLSGNKFTGVHVASAPFPHPCLHGWLQCEDPGCSGVGCCVCMVNPMAVGSLPASWAALTSLQVLAAPGNLLTGPFLPPSAPCGIHTYLTCLCHGAPIEKNLSHGLLPVACMANTIWRRLGMTGVCSLSQHVQHTLQFLCLRAVSRPDIRSIGSGDVCPMHLCGMRITLLGCLQVYFHLPGQRCRNSNT